MEQIDSQGTFKDVTIVDTSNSAPLTDATVHEDDGDVTSYDGVNWTLCQRGRIVNNGRGVVIRAKRDTGSLRLQYGTIVNCSDNDGIDLDISERAYVVHCNVVVEDLSPELSGANGMVVQDCIFAGASSFEFKVQSGRLAYIIQNCVFSGSLTASSPNTAVSNWFNTRTATFHHTQFGTFYCPTSVSPSVSPKPSRTVSPEPSPTISPEPSLTISPEPSPAISPESSATISPEPSRTLSPESSPAVSPRPTSSPLPSRSSPPSPSSCSPTHAFTLGFRLPSRRVRLGIFGFMFSW
jgi:hypothetical protein